MRVSIASRRLSALLVLAALAVTVLTACEKPTPVVGLVSNGTYVNTQANIWCFGMESYTGPGSCTQRSVKPPKLRVRTGDQVNVEAPGEVVERGWYVSVASMPDPETQPSASPGVPEFQRGAIQRDQSYFAFTVPEYPPSGVMPIQIVALGSGEANSGIWQFVLINPDKT